MTTPQAQYELPAGTGNNPQEDYNENFEKADHAGGWMTAEIASGQGGSEGEWYTFDNTGKAKKAQADSLDNCAVTFILTEDTAEGLQGKFLKAGNWYKSLWAGDPSKIYYLDQSTAGAWTTTQPSSGLIIVLGRFDEDTETFHIAEGGGGGGGGLNDHATLTNLAWSVAGHTMDTYLDMAGFGIKNIEKLEVTPDGTSGSNVGLLINNTAFAMSPTFNFYAVQDNVFKTAGATTIANRMVGIEREYRMNDAVNPIGYMQGTNNFFRANQNMGDGSTVFIGHKNLFDIAAGITADGDAIGYWNKWLFNGSGSTIRNLYGLYNDFYTLYSVLGSIWAVNNDLSNGGLGTVAGDVFGNRTAMSYTGTTPITGDMHAYYAWSNSSVQTGTRYAFSCWNSGWDYAFYSDEDTVPSYLAGMLQVDNVIYSEGTTGATPAAAAGSGTRLMWIPSKAAFRAGVAYSTRWDDANIGVGSVAFGSGRTQASGASSFTAGYNNILSGMYSASLGLNNNDNGNNTSMLFGGSNSAVGSGAGWAIGSSNSVGAQSFIAGSDNSCYTKCFIIGNRIVTGSIYNCVMLGFDINGNPVHFEQYGFGRYIAFDEVDYSFVIGRGVDVSNPLVGDPTNYTLQIGMNSTLPSIIVDGSSAGIGVRATVQLYGDTYFSGLAVATGGFSAVPTGSGLNSEAYGVGATATGAGSLAVGPSTTASGINTVSLGYGASTPFAESIALGRAATTTQVNEMVIGATSYEIDHLRVITTGDYLNVYTGFGWVDKNIYIGSNPGGYTTDYPNNFFRAEALSKTINGSASLFAFVVTMNGGTGTASDYWANWHGQITLQSVGGQHGNVRGIYQSLIIHEGDFGDVSTSQYIAGQYLSTQFNEVTALKLWGSLYGIRNYVNANDGEITDDVFGYHLEGKAISGVTLGGSSYGLYIDLHTSWDWAVYVATNVKSFFGGSVEVLFLNLTDSTELTISLGAVTKTQGWHKVDTEADAASDDLDTINGGAAGDRLILQAENDARTVVIKDGTGNIQCAGDFSLDNTQDTIELIYDGSNWLELSRSDNGA